MRKLESQAGVQAPTSDYPKGRIVNNQTLVNEEINGDIVQFFHRMTQLAGITENTLPDNVTNTFQLLEAMKWLIDNGTIGQAIVPIGAWDMDTTQIKLVNWANPVNRLVVPVSIIIFSDVNVGYNSYYLPQSNATSLLGSYFYNKTAQRFELIRDNGGCFDNTDFNDGIINRGYIYAKLLP